MEGDTLISSGMIYKQIFTRKLPVYFEIRKTWRNTYCVRKKIDAGPWAYTNPHNSFEDAWKQATR